MKCLYAVTFEFETRQPLTHRGSMEATAPNTIASRAIKEARKELKPINWTSMSILLDRVGEANGDEEVSDVSEGIEGESE